MSQNKTKKIALFIAIPAILLFQNCAPFRSGQLPDDVQQQAVVPDDGYPTTPTPTPTPGMGTPTPTPTPPMGGTPKPSGWQLTFNDEFNGSTINANYWQNGVITAWDDQYLNGEQECYNPNNAVLSNGELVLTAKAEPSYCRKPAINHPYSSGSLTGVDRFSQLYGYFEIRAKIPSGPGLWPAFWLMGQNYAWPPEIDVFEFISTETTHAYQTFHWSDGNGAHQMNGTFATISDASQNYHVYGLDWQPGKLIWYIDGVATKTVTNDVPNTPFYILLNLAVGGPNDWPGPPNASTVFPASMYVDYVRVYKRLNNGVPNVSPPADTADNPDPSAGL